MPAPNSSAVVTSVPLYGPNFVLGQVTNQYQPVKVSTWDAVIPSPTIGTEPIAGYAAFTTDNVTVTRGSSGNTSSLALKNLVGFFANYNVWEGDVGTNPYTETLGGQFTVPVCEIGSVYVYNSNAISLSVSSGLYVVTAVSSGVTPAGTIVGSVVQSSPMSATLLDISSVARVRTAQTVVGGGCLIDILKT